MCMQCIQDGDHGQPCPQIEAMMDDDMLDLNAPEGLIESAETALSFVLAGKATFTIVSVKTGERMTFRVRAADGNPQMFFVSALIGSDNESDYVYVGFLRADNGGRVLRDAHGPGYLRAGKKGNANDVRFKAFDWLLSALVADHMPRTVEFWHEGRCARCNRLLTDPESIARGFGPECAKRV